MCIAGVRRTVEMIRLVAPHLSAEDEVLTSGTLAVARARLTFAGLPLPSVLISADDVMQGKPHPEGYLAAAAKLGISPEQCAMVEDSPPGGDAAHGARMRIVGILSTHTPAEIGRSDFQVRRLSEILLSSPGVADETSFRLELCDLRRSSPQSGGRLRSANRADQGALRQERQ